MPRELPGRIAGKQVTVNGGDDGRVYFGPFAPGDVVKEVVITAVPTSEFASMPVFAWNVKAFSDAFTDSEATFNAMGRSLLGIATTAAMLSLPVETGPSITAGTVSGTVKVRFPLGWIASHEERYLGFQFSSGASGPFLAAAYPQLAD